MPKPKKRRIISKKTSENFKARPGGRGKKGTIIPETGETFVRSYPGEDPRNEKHNPPVEDPEVVLPEPEDEARGHKYPPPKKNPTFRRIWMEFIDNITKRENFKVGHLNSLEILCDLHVEYEELRAYLRKRGRSYQSFGRQGMAWKFYPEVGQLNNVQAQIREYMKMLGLLLKKDHSTESGDEKEEWS